MRRAVHLCLSLGLTLGLAFGCLPGCAAPPVAPSASIVSDTELLGRLQAAVDNRDETAFDALFTGTPGAGMRAWIWTNLVALPQIRFGLLDDTLVANWRVPGDDLDATHRVGQMACSDDRRDCALTSIGPLAGWPAPLWAVQPMALATAGAVTVLGASDDTTTPDWLTAAETARQAVAAAGLGVLAQAWNGALVVELPRDAAAFAHLLGQDSPADFVTTGALTWVENTGQATPGRAATHIVVNPQTSIGLTAQQRVLLLTHEAVHVATSAQPLAPGAAWVSEGLAEAVAVAGDPAAATERAAQAHSACTAAGLTPPADAAFSGTDAAAQAVAYATAQVLVGLIRQNLNDAAPVALLALWQGQTVTGVDLANWSKAWCTT